MAVLRIRAQARAEIAEAFEWYLTRSQDASADFLAELDVAMKKIVEAPEYFPVVRGRLRRVLLHRFPYAVYFKLYHWYQRCWGHPRSSSPRYLASARRAITTRCCRQRI